MNNIKLLTFNLRYGRAKDGNNSWPYRRHMVFYVIKKYDADIIGLQECEQFQLDEILNEFPFYKSMGISRRGKGTNDEMTPILYKNRFYSLKNDTFWLSLEPNQPGSTYGTRLPRICTWSEFIDKETTETLNVYNTHLDHESQYARSQSSKQIISFISNAKNAIFMGDFNCITETSDEIMHVLKNNFIDSYKQLNKTEHGTFHAFNGHKNGPRIDFIFIRDFNVTESTVITYNESGKFPSDHFPLYSNVAFNTINNRVGSFVRSIYNKQYDEYLYAAQIMHDASRRKVLNWIPKGYDTQGIWVFIPIEELPNTYIIKSNYFNEYLCVENNTLNNSDKRYALVTYNNNVLNDNKFKWKIIKANENNEFNYIMNVAFDDEYFYADNDTYDHERRFIYTKKTDNSNIEKFMWKLVEL